MKTNKNSDLLSVWIYTNFVGMKYYAYVCDARKIMADE